MEQNKNPIVSPADWGGSQKSNTHYAWIDESVRPIRPSKDFVLYKGRWRPIKEDEIGSKYVEGPGFIVFFEIREFEKPEGEKKQRLIYDPTAGDGIDGVCGNCLNGGHHNCHREGCKCAAKGHKAWWWVPENQAKKNPFKTLLRQGFTLLTSRTRDWTKELIARNNAAEELLIFESFREDDDGRSRNRVATCFDSSQAKAIVSAVNGTYGNGINPDAVPGLLKSLTDLAYAASFKGFTGGVLSSDIIEAAKAAIEKAKL